MLRNSPHSCQSRSNVPCHVQLLRNEVQTSGGVVSAGVWWFSARTAV